MLAVACLQNVWVCARDLQLIRADRIISLLVPVATGYGAASPDDHTLHRAVSAEIERATGGETLTRVRLADCGKSPAAELLAGLAAALGAAAAAGPGEGCVYVSPSTIGTGSRGGSPRASFLPPGRKARPRAALP